MIYASKRQSGFTIIELMIAISIFSVILLVCMSAIVFMGRLYYKGISNAKTQEVARSTVDEISDAIKFNVQTVQLVSSSGGWDGAYCIGSKKFSFKKNKVLVKNPSNSSQTNQTNEALVVSNDTACGSGSVSPTPTNNSANPKKELLGEGMRVVDFSVTPQYSTKVVSVSLTVAFGGDGTESDRDIFNYASNTNTITSCRSGYAGAQFCSVNSLSKTIYGDR